MMPIKTYFFQALRILCILLVLAVFWLLYDIVLERHYISKKKETKLGITVTELENNWGSPDKILAFDKRERALFYGPIIFKVDGNVVVSSHIDD